MSFTYTPANISNDNEDFVSVVRWLVQDVTSTASELSDEEITALYSTTSADDPQTVRNLSAAISAAQALERRYRKQATFSSGGTSVNYKDRAEAWGKVVAQLENDLYAAQMAEQGLSGGILYAGRGPLYDDGGGLLW